MVIDPVCGMQVDEKKAKFKTTYQGKVYYFCAPGCKFLFEEKPQKYVSNSSKKIWKYRLIVNITEFFKRLPEEHVLQIDPH